MGGSIVVSLLLVLPATRAAVPALAVMQPLEEGGPATTACCQTKASAPYIASQQRIDSRYIYMYV